ncbi:MAG: cell division protein ZapA [Deferribacteres bacterium]|nr:cell division protein ZapA [candidate division KSB1 bacterium]MCB9512506.1 cell division protein ZapA [Deferribacteres bacterium]
MNENSERNVIKLTIYGTEYPIKGDTDVDYIKKVAGYIDQKMYEVERNTSAKSSLKVAILAALNIADELFRERAENQKNIRTFEKRIERLTQILDNIEQEFKSDS